MAKVSVTVAGRSYDLACDDGEEAKVSELAALVDLHANRLTASIGTIDERRLFLMISILLANELQAAQAQPELGLGTPDSLGRGGGEEVAAESIFGVAGQLESLAARIEDA